MHITSTNPLFQMPLQPTCENKANLENYEHAQKSIDTVLANIEKLKGEGANAELLSQINQLDEAYENAIRIRAMRIQTLESHCGDRDSELVELRKAIVARDRAVYLSKLGHYAWVFTAVCLCVLFALPWMPPAVIRYFSFAYNLFVAALPESPGAIAACTCVATLGATRIYSTYL